MLEYTFGAFDDNQCIKQFDLTRRAIIMIYFSFTTLSTVGIGDFHPRSNFERSIIAPTLLFGAMCLAYISNEFVKITLKLD